MLCLSFLQHEHSSVSEGILLLWLRLTGLLCLQVFNWNHRASELWAGRAGLVSCHCRVQPHMCDLTGILVSLSFYSCFDFDDSWNLQRHLGLQIRDAADDSGQIYLRVSVSRKWAQQRLIVSTKVLWGDTPLYPQSCNRHWVFCIRLHTWWTSLG